MQRLLTTVRPLRALLLAGFDFAAWLFSFLAMALAQFSVGYSPWAGVRVAALFGLSTGLAFLLLGAVFAVHQGRSAVGSFPDALFTSLVGGVVALGALAVNLGPGTPMRLSISVTAPLCAFVIMLGGRAAYRIFREYVHARTPGRVLERQPVVVIGAGDGAAQLVRSMQYDPRSKWRPVALLDDDPYKKRRRLSGVSILGKTTDLAEVADRTDATAAILAIPSASSEMVQSLNRAANAAGIEFKVVPGVDDLTNPAQLQIADVRDIDVTDFLGRTPVETDVESIAEYLTGKRVLVTGAGGSIGAELCRQIAKYGPAELIMLDRDESALHGVQLSIHGRALLDSNDTELGDIRDARYVRELFARRAPHVVFHAAALKHLPLLEASPGEAVKTNVWGTQHVLEAALHAGVERFVNISTDKAANPCSVLGYTKRLAEGLTAHTAMEADGRYMSVRFGNVLGSRGSVLTSFTAQIARGGPVTVTDPRVERYFMTIREAVQLVIQAGALGDNGDVLVLDMGEPVRIEAMARQLIDMSGKPVEVVFTGLRDGEKLSEELFGDGEADVRLEHPLISHAPVPGFDGARARQFDPYAAPGVIARQLAQGCADLSEAVPDLVEDELDALRESGELDALIHAPSNPN